MAVIFFNSLQKLHNQARCDKMFTRICGKEDKSLCRKKEDKI